MRKHALALGMTALLAVSACKENGGAGNTTAQTPAAQKAAGTKTIAAGLAEDSQFMAAGEIFSRAAIRWYCIATMTKAATLMLSAILLRRLFSSFCLRARDSSNSASASRSPSKERTS